MILSSLKFLAKVGDGFRDLKRMDLQTAPISRLHFQATKASSKSFPTNVPLSLSQVPLEK